MKQHVRTASVGVFCRCQSCTVTTHGHGAEINEILLDLLAAQAVSASRRPSAQLACLLDRSDSRLDYSSDHTIYV